MQGDKFKTFAKCVGLRHLVVELVWNDTSTNSNATLSIRSIVEEVNENEIIQQEDVEMLKVDQNFMTNADN